MSKYRLAAGRILSVANEENLRVARNNLETVLSQLESDPESAALLKRAPANLGQGYHRINRYNQDEDRASVIIHGDIGGFWGGIDADYLARELEALDVSEMDVYINSPGGIIFDGLAIYRAFVRHKARVTMHIEGVAASIASVIIMAGDEIRIAEGTRIMVHKPWSFAGGDADDFRKEADILDALQEDIVDLYVARTEQSREDLANWVNNETWFSAREAVEKGFADEMVPAKTKENKSARSSLFNLFANTPTELLQTADETPAIREYENLIRDSEGLSLKQAKRLAALARKTFGARDAGRQQPIEGPRDAGSGMADELEQLANRIRNL